MGHLIELSSFLVIILAAFTIAWGAECAQFYLSQGLALAILAWMQTLPEFSVEAVIAYHAGADPSMMHLVTANFTGSLRLFVGLGWPMVFFIGYWSTHKDRRQNTLFLENEHAVPVVFFVPVLFYMLFIYFKRELNWMDGSILFAFYFLYLFWLSKMPKLDSESVDDLHGMPRRIMRLKGPLRITAILGCFVAGILMLMLFTHRFVDSMLHLALAVGISQFVFVQWIAPALSELPEAITASYWAKTNRAAMGLINFVSSCVNQWTLLIGMIPFIVILGAKANVPVVFDDFQRTEILLTILQGGLGMLFLANMEFKIHEAGGLFVLWLAQFIIPSLRSHLTYVYGAWLAIELLRLPFEKNKTKNAFSIFARLTKDHVFKKTGPRPAGPAGAGS